MLGNRGFPEARSRLCVCRSLLPHDLCHGRSSSCWLPALKGHSQSAETSQGESPGNKYVNFISKYLFRICTPSSTDAPVSKSDIEEVRGCRNPELKDTSPKNSHQVVTKSGFWLSSHYKIMTLLLNWNIESSFN